MCRPGAWARLRSVDSDEVEECSQVEERQSGGRFERRKMPRQMFYAGTYLFRKNQFSRVCFQGKEKVEWKRN